MSNGEVKMEELASDASLRYHLKSTVNLALRNLLALDLSVSLVTDYVI